MYDLQISESLDKKFSKLSSKNPKQLSMINQKVLQILENPYIFKNLKGSMKGLMRVHIDGHFVLIFEVVGNIVHLLDYNHHDKVY